MLPAPIHEVLQRVQDNADYMPASQRDKVMSTNLGHDWRDLSSLSMSCLWLLHQLDKSTVLF
jgi:predicted unusual protein kinase regulating ubiquinone biosynthesis (AarF/ABC1/UbiB family)